MLTSEPEGNLVMNFERILLYVAVLVVAYLAWKHFTKK